MEIGLHYPPLMGSSKEILAGMAGQRTDLYQRMLKHLVEQARYVDETGYYGFGFSEHHLSIEGITVSNNPAMLDLYIALHTKRIDVGELGFVLPAHDPLRVASDIAVLDQMSGGRAYAGFVRGIQERWLNTFGQHISPALADNVTDLPAHMQARAELFDESITVIRKAFTSQTFNFKGKEALGDSRPTDQMERRTGDAGGGPWSGCEQSAGGDRYRTALLQQSRADVLRAVRDLDAPG
jgi:alkanesulfonate monooxygenase SsuD/methylene tetrahydromethanopterin reductase-like flavin-dependent oxidoreductase (luciferase family)